MPCIDELKTVPLRVGSVFGPNSRPDSLVLFRTKPTLVSIIPSCNNGTCAGEWQLYRMKIDLESIASSNEVVQASGRLSRYLLLTETVLQQMKCAQKQTI